MAEMGPIDSELRETERVLSAHRYRRYLLYTLYLYTGPLELADVAHQITVWETGEAAEHHLDKRLEIYMSLYHDHRPELVDANVIDYDQEEDVVRLGPHGEQLEPIMRHHFREEVEELLAAEAATFDDTG